MFLSHLNDCYSPLPLYFPAQLFLYFFLTLHNYGVDCNKVLNFSVPQFPFEARLIIKLCIATSSTIVNINEETYVNS